MEILEYFEQEVGTTTEIGDLDRTRDLKIRTLAGLVLTPVFRELQPRLNYAAFSQYGVTPMQYYDDFENCRAPFGYGDRFSGRYEIRLCRSVSNGSRQSNGQEKHVERLIQEARATIVDDQVQTSRPSRRASNAESRAATAETLRSRNRRLLNLRPGCPFRFIR